MGVLDRVISGWNAFIQNGSATSFTADYGPSYGIRPGSRRFSVSNEKSIVASIYTQIALDLSQVTFEHIRTDENGRYLEPIPSRLQQCLSVSANLDQAATAFKMDMAIELCDKGHIAVVPVDATANPVITDSYDIISLRVGEVVQWFPQHVRVRLYDERKGQKREITLPKRCVALIENPMASVMNSPNSTLQRLIRKLNLLDAIDEQSGSGKLDIIIQLPYQIKTEARRQQAEIRREAIEQQLSGSKYGIAYTDGTERITQLNRPSENNLMAQIEYLTKNLYSQLGINDTVFNGTADEATMLNYNNRTIKPLAIAIQEEFNRKFLSRTARTQRQKIIYRNDPFSFVPVSQIAEIADKFTRNEILSSNEIRGIIGFRPSTDPKADQLVNSNLNQSNEARFVEEDPMAEGAPVEETELKRIPFEAEDPISVSPSTLRQALRENGQNGT